MKIGLLSVGRVQREHKQDHDPQQDPADDTHGNRQRTGHEPHREKRENDGQNGKPEIKGGVTALPFKGRAEDAKLFERYQRNQRCKSRKQQQQQPVGNFAEHRHWSVLGTQTRAHQSIKTECTEDQTYGRIDLVRRFRSTTQYEIGF